MNFFKDADKVAVTFSSFHDVSIHVGQMRREAGYFIILSVLGTCQRVLYKTAYIGFHF